MVFQGGGGSGPPVPPSGSAFGKGKLTFLLIYPKNVQTYANNIQLKFVIISFKDEILDPRRFLLLLVGT